MAYFCFKYDLLSKSEMKREPFPDRQHIEFQQLKLLRKLLSELIQKNKFYSKKFFQAYVPTKISSLKEFSKQMPFTTKQELVEDQSCDAPFGSNLTYPLERYTRLSQTSGTTSQPLRWLDTPENWSWMLKNWIQIFRIAGVKTGDRIFFAFSFGPFLGFWTAFEAASQMGCFCIPGGGLSSATRLNMILENKIDVLCCTPTYAIRLAETATETKINLKKSNLRKIIVAGEIGGSILKTRSYIEKFWRYAQVYDHHGMTETGPVSYECPKRPGVLHIMESAYYAEVIHPETGNEVEPGQKGELVLTTLGRIGSPVLRYRTGDLVKKSSKQPCVCGRYNLALEGGILGRTDDMVVVRGVNIYPSAVETVMRQYEGVGEYRVEVHRERSMTEMKILVEPTTKCRHPELLSKQLEAAMRDAFALRIPVKIVARGSLPRFEMKSKRWVHACSRTEKIKK